MENLKQKFLQHFPKNLGTTILTYFSPGRVNLIGEHTDYNGGYVMPFAIPYGISAVAQFAPETDIIEVRSAQFSSETNDSIIFRRDDTGYFATENLNFVGKQQWGYYIAGVIHLLQQKYSLKLPGIQVLFDSNLPVRAGLSSSAALEVLWAFMLTHQQQHILHQDRVALALFCQFVENNYVGVHCGIMDQFAVSVSQNASAILLNCNTLDYEFVPFDIPNHTVLVLNTNKDRALITSPYNERYNECQAALALINKQKNVACLCEANLDEAEFCLKDSILRRRAQHVISESKRTAALAVKLVHKRWAEVGQLLNESHLSLRDNYEVTGVELDTLVETAQAQKGCLGARMTGAGFGGCAIAIVADAHVSTFSESITTIYAQKIGLSLDLLPVSACESVRYCGNI